MLANMPLHCGRSCRSSRNCRSGANFLSKPEGLGNTEGPGSGGSGAAERSGGRKVRAGPEGPGVAKLARTEKWGSWTWAEKLEEKPKSSGEKQGNWRKRRVGRLDLRATHKKFGAIFGGDFRIRTKNNKIRLETQWGGSEIVINVVHDTNMM